MKARSILPRGVLCVVLALGGLSPAVELAPGGEERLTVLLSTSDGIDAAGLAALHDALAPETDVVVVAPRTDQSGSSHSLTHRIPILVTTAPRSDVGRWYAAEASPATCVRLALKALLETPPDLVITGINSTYTLASMVWTSSTVAAAREAALWGIPAIAVSQAGHDPADLRATAAFIRRLVRQLRQAGLLQPGLLLNVNAPRGTAAGIKGPRITRQTTLPPHQSYDRRVAPSGQVYFWDVWKQVEADAPDTDVGAYHDGYVTLTPLAVAQTDYKRRDALRRTLAL